MKQHVIISRHLKTELAKAIAECEHDRIFVLVDETTNKLCWTLVKDYLCLKDTQTIVIGATDRRKNLDTLVHVWESLQQGKATRHSLLIKKYLPLETSEAHLTSHSPLPIASSRS